MELTERFETALTYAARAHAQQKRKGTQIPYISHLLATASLALEHGANEDEAIAALLHDAAEDQGGPARLEDIRQRFGEAVAAIVAACTGYPTEGVDLRQQWRRNRENYLAHLPAASASVRLVSACDKLHNARCMLADYRRQGEALWSRFHTGRDDILWYFRALADAFGVYGPKPLAEELDRVVSELERLVAAAGC